MTEQYGWFTYGRNPSGRAGQWTIIRAPDDPPLVVWRVDETTWIVDDDINDQHARLDGFTEAEVRAALVFAQAMNWIPAGTQHAIRELRA
jgi:hypothetical protein